MHNLAFLALTVPQIWRGSQNFKSRSRDPFLATFDLMMNLHANFDVSSFNRSRDMGGSQNFTIRLRDPFLTLLTQFCIFVVSTPGDESACKIWRF